MKYLQLWETLPKDNGYPVFASMNTQAASDIIRSFTDPLVSIFYNQAGATIAVPQMHAKPLAGRNTIVYCWEVFYLLSASFRHVIERPKLFDAFALHHILRDDKKSIAAKSEEQVDAGWPTQQTPSLKTPFRETPFLKTLSLYAFAHFSQTDHAVISKYLDWATNREALGRALELRQAVCLSSRHYPHISISKAIEMTLEGQEGHDQDISKFLSSELRAGNGTVFEAIKDEILKRAGEYVSGLPVDPRTFSQRTALDNKFYPGTLTL